MPASCRARILEARLDPHNDTATRPGLGDARPASIPWGSRTGPRRCPLITPDRCPIGIDRRPVAGPRPVAPVADHPGQGSMPRWHRSHRFRESPADRWPPSPRIDASQAGNRAEPRRSTPQSCQPRRRRPANPSPRPLDPKSMPAGHQNPGHAPTPEAKPRRRSPRNDAIHLPLPGQSLEHVPTGVRQIDA